MSTQAKELLQNFVDSVDTYVSFQIELNNLANPYNKVGPQKEIYSLLDKIEKSKTKVHDDYLKFIKSVENLYPKFQIPIEGSKKFDNMVKKKYLDKDAREKGERIALNSYNKKEPQIKNIKYLSLEYLTLRIKNELQKENQNIFKKRIDEKDYIKLYESSDELMEKI